MKREARLKRDKAQKEVLSLPGEIWKIIPKFPNYYVSNLGRLKCLAGISPGGRKFPLRIIKSTWLRRGKKCYHFIRAQLILLTFVGKPKSKRENNARHLNDNPKDNRLSNLAWGTAKDNYDDAVRNGSHGPGSPGAKLRGQKLKNRPRPPDVRAKISQTKKLFPERQYLNHPKSTTTGRFITL